LEAGCSDAETAAITGQSRNIVEHYAKQVNQRRLAAAAVLKWEAAAEARVAKPKKRRKAGFVQPAQEFVQPPPAWQPKSLKILERAKGIEPSTLSLGNRIHGCDVRRPAMTRNDQHARNELFMRVSAS